MRPRTRLAVLLLVAGAITVLAWPITSSRPASLDGSWQIGLHMAVQQGLRHGPDIVFTYGPLGFLGFAHPYLGATSTLALVAAIAIYLALIGTMLLQATRILPLWAAALVTLLAARIFVLLPPFEALQALAFLWLVEALAGRIPLAPLPFAAAAGAVAGFALLGKVNVGIFMVALGAVTVATTGRPRWASLAVYSIVTALTALALWLATGQRIDDLTAFATGVYGIVAGYNDAMGADLQPKRTWIYLALAGAAVIVAWAAWQSSREWPRHRRVGLLAVMLVFGFAMLKTAVVREHTWYVFASSLVAMFAFAPGIERRTWLVAVLALGMAFAGSSAIEPKTYLDVGTSVRAIAVEARDAFLPGRMDRAADRTRARLRRGFALEPSTLAAIGNHTVHVDPVLAAVAYAYPELRWRPLPIFQTYSAYTPDLDQRDADMLRSDVAPERILREFTQAKPSDLQRLSMGRDLIPGEIVPTTVDGRNRWFEAPHTTLETFCRYVETDATDRWQVLARTERSCGDPEPLATVTARAGEQVSIPVESRPDRFVIVRIRGLEPSLLDRVRAMAFKGPDWYVRVDDTRYRLVAATAADGLLLAVPAAADGSRPFAFGEPFRTISVSQGLHGRGSVAPLTYEFMSVPLHR